MLIKNVSVRPWGVMGTYILPGKTEEVDCTEADIKGNDDLEVVQPKAKPGPKPQFSQKED